MRQSSFFEPASLGRQEMSDEREANSRTAVSVVMSVCNAEKDIAAAIESVLKQSFTDFEFIIVDAGSTDNTCAVIRSFEDKHIHLIDSNQGHIEALNTGMKASSGKYIAFLEANGMMHVDRLKLQYSIMEERPEITICGSWETVFSKRMPKRVIEKKLSGWIEQPLIQLLFDDQLINPAYTVRKSFVDGHNLFFENEYHVRDYKFWVETALLNGGFYIDSQTLVYSRISDTNLSATRRIEKLKAIAAIKNEILTALCKKYEATHPALQHLCNACRELATQQLIEEDDIFKLFYSLFMKNRDTFSNFQ